MSFLYSSISILYIYIYTYVRVFRLGASVFRPACGHHRPSLTCAVIHHARRGGPQHTSRFSPSPPRALRPHTASAFPFRTHISSHSSVYSQQMWCRTPYLASLLTVARCHRRSTPTRDHGHHRETRPGTTEHSTRLR